MADQLYNPETHRQQPSKPRASGGGKGSGGLGWFVLALVLGVGGAGLILKFLSALGSGRFANTGSGAQGEMFGSMLFGVILIFLASKCLRRG